MKAVSTKLTAADKKANGYPDDVGMAGGPEYPWGMRLTLDGPLMDKLGLTELPKVGVEVQIFGTARVCSTSSNESKTGERKSMELCVEAFGLGDEAEEGEPDKSAADVLFGAKA